MQKFFKAFSVLLVLSFLSSNAFAAGTCDKAFGDLTIESLNSFEAELVSKQKLTEMDGRSSYLFLNEKLDDYGMQTLFELNEAFEYLQLSDIVYPNLSGILEKAKIFDYMNQVERSAFYPAVIDQTEKIAFVSLRDFRSGPKKADQESFYYQLVTMQEEMGWFLNAFVSEVPQDRSSQKKQLDLIYRAPEEALFWYETIVNAFTFMKWTDSPNMSSIHWKHFISYLSSFPTETKEQQQVKETLLLLGPEFLSDEKLEEYYDTYELKHPKRHRVEQADDLNHMLYGNHLVGKPAISNFTAAQALDIILSLRQEFVFMKTTKSVEAFARSANDADLEKFLGFLVDKLEGLGFPVYEHGISVSGLSQAMHVALAAEFPTENYDSWLNALSKVEDMLHLEAITTKTAH